MCRSSGTRRSSSRRPFTAIYVVLCSVALVLTAVQPMLVLEFGTAVPVPWQLLLTPRCMLCSTHLDKHRQSCCFLTILGSAKQLVVTEHACRDDQYLSFSRSNPGLSPVPPTTLYAADSIRAGSAAEAAPKMASCSHVVSDSGFWALANSLRQHLCRFVHLHCYLHFLT